MVAETIAAAAVGVGAAAVTEKATEHSSLDVALLEQIRNELTMANHYAKRQLERTLYPVDLRLIATTVVIDGITWSQTRHFMPDGRRRGSHITVSIDAAGDTASLARVMMGSSILLPMYVTSYSNPARIDIPIMFTPGTEFYVLYDSNEITDAFTTLWLYTDMEDFAHRNA